MRKEEFREPREPRDYKKQRFPIALVIQFCIVLVSAVAAFLYFRNPERLLADDLTRGNRALNEGRYGLAELYFKEALSIEENSFAALMGELEVYGSRKEQDEFDEVLTRLWQLAGGKDVLSVTEKEKLVRATLLSSAYASESVYLEALERGYEITKNPSMGDSLRLFYLQYADYLWQEGEYQDAREILGRALDSMEVDQELKNAARRIVNEEVRVCMNRLQYEEALEALDWLQEHMGNTTEKYLAEEILLLEKKTEKTQTLLLQLEQKTESDKENEIEKLFTSDRWRRAMDGLQGTIYSETVLQQGIPQGKGAAVYEVENTWYAYYGDFVDGKREGEGDWYYLKDGYVVHNHLLWENDLPEGMAKIETTQKILYKKRGGVDLSEGTSYVLRLVNLHHGVWDGKLTEQGEVRGDTIYDSYTYEMSFDLKSGYEVPLTEIPDAVVPFLHEGERIVSITEVVREDPYWGEFTSSVWNYFQATQMKVRGLRIPFLPQTIKNVEIKVVTE
ncbi:MAG: hypothetical protein MJ105_08870 [Lachnospiraceae bacterium]|nr:hypothetical protein [Lachnospiraceae bacterium]